MIGRTRALDARLALPASGAWASTALLLGNPAWAPAIAVVAFVLAGTLALVSLRAAAIAIVAVGVAAFAVCATSVALQSPGRSPAVLAEAARDHRPIPVLVEVSQTVSPGDRSWRGVVRLAQGREVAVPVRVAGELPAHRLEVGSIVSLAATVVETDAGDASAWLLMAQEEPVHVSTPAPAIAWAAEMRASFAAITAGLPGWGAELLPGLAIGDTTAVSPALEASMLTSSLSHLTAVSGANCAIVVALGMLLGRVLGIPRWARVAVACALLLAFVVLVTPEPSVLRAAVMATVALILLARGRAGRGLPLLGVAVIGLLIVDPWLARSAGFALSVLATAGLIVLAPPLVDRLARLMPRSVALIIAAPSAAQVACQPVLVLLDPSIAIFGVLANVLAAPAAPAATIVGLIACVAGSLSPEVGLIIAAIAWVPAAWIGAVADFFGGLPGASLSMPGGAGGAVVLAAITMVIAVVLLSRGWTRRVAAIVLGVSVVASVGAAAGTRWGELHGRPPHWSLALCDVGQGDAIVLRSRDQVALVDAGPDPTALEACLDDLGVDRLDLVVLTHFDHDHVGGVAAIIGRAGLVLVGPTARPADEEVVARLGRGGARVQTASRGDQGRLGEWAWRVEWPRPGAHETGNEASVVLRLDPAGECRDGCLSALLLGDLGARAQASLARLAAARGVDVVKVSHHGSADQFAGLYESLAAPVGLIGVGADNGYGHPTPELLAMLDVAGTRPWRTDRCGLVLVASASRGVGVEVWTQRAACSDSGRE